MARTRQKLKEKPSTLGMRERIKNYDDCIVCNLAWKRCALQNCSDVTQPSRYGRPVCYSCCKGCTLITLEDNDYVCKLRKEPYL